MVTAVGPQHVVPIEGQLLVGVQRHQHDAAVGVDEVGLDEAHAEAVQHCGLMEVAEGRQVVLPHQDVRVPQEGQPVAIGADGEIIEGAIFQLEVEAPIAVFVILGDLC